MKTKPSFLLAAVALIACTGGTSFGLTVPVAQNSYSTTTGRLTNATGEATSLVVAETGSETALLEFNLGYLNVVPATIQPANITSATLDIYVVKTDTNAALTVHQVTTAWQETFAGFSEPLPTIDPTVLATIPGSELPPTGTKGFVSVDVTGPVIAALESGTNLSVAIETATHGALVELGSKNWPSVGYAAYLDIETTPTPLAIGTVTGGTAVGATITGTSPSQTLNLEIPNGQLTNANTAIGYLALQSINPNPPLGFSDNNTAVGYEALQSTTTGFENVAIGYEALLSNTSGYQNTACGSGYTLGSNTSGWQNTASGWSALIANTVGGANTAFGFETLTGNTTGFFNTAIGYQALTSNSNGWRNIAIGPFAGSNLTSGSNNIDIGDYPPNGTTADDMAGEQNTIRIGEMNTQTATYIAGIMNATAAGGVQVLIDPATGQLGTKTSSRRFKQNIKSMDNASDALLSLRPVTFQYRPEIDPKGIPQYGLIAEEVEKACPDLVVRDKQGRIFTVRYDAVNAMLLNEFLKEHHRVEEQGEVIAEQEKRLVAQDQINAGQQQRIQELTASVAKLSQQIATVAQRLDGKDYQPVVNHIGSVPNE